MYSENSKIVVCLDSLSKQIYYIWVLFGDYCLVTAFSSGSFARSHRVTDEAFIAET